jgi:AcrR family transcriptional regulator
MKKHVSRKITEQRFIGAVATVIAESGIGGLGVNVVSRRAGVDKVLLYRYFGGLPGLLKRYSETNEFWPTRAELFDSVPEKIGPDNVREAAKRVFYNFYRGFKKRPITLDILAYECIGRNELTESLEEIREVRGREVFEELAARGFRITRNSAICAAVFTAAIQYLAVRARGIKIFGELRLDTAQGWNTMADVMAEAIEAMTVWE